MRIQHIIITNAAVLVAAFAVSCSKSPSEPTGQATNVRQVPAEVAYRSDVESAFSNLSIDLIGPALSDGSVTSIIQLKLECRRRYPSAPPLFKVYAPSDVKNGEYPQYGLPARDYFWLRDWSTNDSRSTPLIWSYFHPPWGIDVVYLAIDGSAHHCSSNEFASLVAPVSNRVEQAALTR